MEQKRLKFKVDISKLSEHLQKCQYAVLALTFSILLLAIASPEKPPAQKELDNLSAVLEKQGDRWLDRYLRYMRPNIPNGFIEVTMPDRKKMLFESPCGLLLDSPFSQSITFNLSHNATRLLMLDGLGLYMDNRKRGIPPIWAESEQILHFKINPEIQSRNDLIKTLTLNDVMELWKRLNTLYECFYIEKVDGQYQLSENVNNSIEVKYGRSRLKVIRTTDDLSLKQNNKKMETGKLWYGREGWKIVENGRTLSVNKPSNALIFALPDNDDLNNITNGTLFLVKTKKQVINLFDPIKKVCSQLGIDATISFESTFPLLSSQSNERKQISLINLEHALDKESKDPGSKLNAEILGIKVEGLHVWWLLPLALLLVQMYFLLHMQRLHHELLDIETEEAMYPLGMLYPGNYSKGLGFMFLLFLPIAITFSAFLKLHSLVGGFNLEVWLLLAITIGIALMSGLIFKHLFKLRDILAH